MFLHEGLGSVALWRDFPDRVCARAGRRGLIYSRHGNGFSDVLENPRNVQYMHAEALEVLPELLEAFGLSRPILFGHSDGASIAIICAATHPSAVSGLILEAPHVFVEPFSVQSISEIGETYELGKLRERMARYHKDVDRTFFGWNDIWLSPEFRDWDITSYLPRITAPVLCIQGKDDEYGTLAQIDAIAGNVPSTVDRLILDGCGHSPHRDRAGYVERAAADWIREELSTPDALGSVRPTENRSEIP